MEDPSRDVVDWSRLAAATAYALSIHARQTRKGTHTLHDVIEDCGAAQEAVILQRFGPRVTRIVRACSDADTFSKPPWRERKEQYLETVDPDALLVSCCDKFHNARAIVEDLRTPGRSCSIGSMRRGRAHCGITGRLPNCLSGGCLGPCHGNWQRSWRRCSGLAPHPGWLRDPADGAQGRSRTTDTAIFSRMLYQLSYLGIAPGRVRAAGGAGLNPRARDDQAGGVRSGAGFSSSSSSFGRSEGFRYWPENQRPRSTSAQRREQNGRVCGTASRLQIGQAACGMISAILESPAARGQGRVHAQ